MRILLVVERNTKYGSAFSAKQLVMAIPKEKYEVTVLVPNNIDDISFYTSLECEVIKMPFVYCSIGISSNKLKNIIKIPIRQLEYLLCTVVSTYKLTSIVSLRRYDIIHCNSSRLDIAAIVACKTNTPLLWHVREFGDKDFDRIELNHNLVKLMNRTKGYIVGVSSAVCNHWIKKGVHPEKIRRVYNGVCPVPCKKEFRYSNGVINFVFLGGIAETKGQYQVIEALGTIKECNCVVDIVGEGDKKYIEFLKKRSKELGVFNKIRFLGYQKGFSNQLYKYDCGLSCSKSEGFGRNTAEYMMAGLPVIASNTGANVELVLDGETGYLYEYNNVSDLAEKMLNIASDHRIAMRMGMAGNHRATTMFSVDEYSRNIVKLYDELAMSCDQVT